MDDDSRIFPVFLDTPMPAMEAMRLHHAWLNARPEHAHDDEPWLPIGHVGPILILAHYKAFQPCILPEWAAQRVKIPDKHYHGLLGFVRDSAPKTTPYEAPAEPLPSDRPNINSPLLAADIILKHFCLRATDRNMIQAMRAKGTTDIPNDQMPEGMIEGMHYLCNQKTRIVDPRILSLDIEVTKLADGTPYDKKTAALRGNNDDGVAYFLCGRLSLANQMRDFLSSRMAANRLALSPLMVLCPNEHLSSALTERRSQADKIKSQGAEAARLSDEDRSRPDIVIDPDIIGKLDLRSTEIEPRDVFNCFLLGGIRDGASDIHFEQVGSKARVRYRIDGVLRVVSEVAEDRMRTMIAVARSGYIPGFKPNAWDCQDARCSVAAGELKVNIRASLTPHFKNGYQVLVLRILAKRDGIKSLEKLGISSRDAGILRRAFTRPNGLILVTGPTGSGKTTTLYSCLDEVNTEDVRITTIEDPVEIELPGATQGQIDEARKVGFAEMLRAALRQDPDIILIGEIRDRETAKKALEAACTGHLVFATVHSNSEVEAISRVMDLIDDEKQLPVLAKALILLQSQRLLLKLCPTCRRELPLDMAMREVFGNAGVNTPEKIYMANNDPEHKCDRCYHGYNGRTAIMSLLPVTEEIANAIAEGKTSMQIRKLADDRGFPALYTQALHKVAEGITDMKEASDWNDPWANFNLKP